MRPKAKRAGAPGKAEKGGKAQKGKPGKPGKPGKSGKPEKAPKVGRTAGGSKKRADELSEASGDDVAPVQDDWLGAAGDEEELSGLDIGSGDEGSEAEGSEAPADGPEEADSGAEGGRLALRVRPDDDEEGGAGRHGGSKTLARISSGAQPGDLTALKQQIYDDASLLGGWRKARELGETRSRDEVFSGLVANCAVYFGYSEELAEYFLQMFSPEQALKFFEANERPRPLTIRTNSLKARRTSLMQALTARKVHVDPVGPWTKVGLKVYDSAVPVGATPEYLGGHYMIQSASSFIPVMALAPQENEVILDMAAAPGGKTTYIGQLMRNTGTLFANDLRRDRCKSLVANVHRMGLTNVVVLNMDGRKLVNKMPKLDRVLLDAPCTGSGIIARDPSVKVKRAAKDFQEHSVIQKELLLAAIDMVDAKSATGGYIVYSTCSCSVEENEAVIDFALQVRNVELVSFTSAVNFGVEGLTKYRERRFSPTLNLARRYYPHVHNMDGFFVAKLKKLSNEVPQRAKKVHRSKGDDQAQVWGEEHWTPDLLEKVADFEDPAEKEAKAQAAKAAQGLNKRDRKKLRRAEKLKAREAAAGKASDGSASATAAVRPGEPKEEPKPSKGATKAKKGKRKAPADGAEAAASQSPKSAEGAKGAKGSKASKGSKGPQEAKSSKPAKAAKEAEAEAKEGKPAAKKRRKGAV